MKKFIVRLVQIGGKEMINEFEFFKNQISKKLKSIRIDNNYTQADVAKGTNLNICTVANYENSKGTLKLSIINRLLSFYGYSIHIFFNTIYENFHNMQVNEKREE